MNIQFKEELPKLVYLRVTEREHSEFKRIAKLKHTSVSEVVRVFTRAAMEEYLTTNPKAAVGGEDVPNN